MTNDLITARPFGFTKVRPSFVETAAWLPVAQLGEHWFAEWKVVGSNPGWTNTQGLIITEKKVVLPLLHLTSTNGQTFWSSQIRTKTCRLSHSTFTYLVNVGRKCG